jgi:hypothetical protein
LERDPARALSIDLVQTQRLATYSAWVEGLRTKAKIETLIQE